MIEKTGEKIRCLSYANLIDWSIRHFGEEPDEKERKTRELWLERLTELLKRTYSLDLDVAD